MLSNETVRKLHEMRLGVMAEAFSAQLEDAQFQALPFEDRFAMLVDAEWSARKSNRLTRLIRNAGYADPAACVENIEYHPERRLDREQILRLASCTYLQEAHNVIILGATGAGKTYLACALGMAASRSFYSVRYIRLPDLLVEISVARANGTYRDYMKKLRKEKLLILDEWLLYPLKEAEARDVLELVEARNKVASTIFCSQYDTSEWHENLYDPTLADAICDRIIYNAYTIQGRSAPFRRWRCTIIRGQVALLGRHMHALPHHLHPNSRILLMANPGFCVPSSPQNPPVLLPQETVCPAWDSPFPASSVAKGITH